jgi:serine/threonine protein kinase
VAESNLQGRLLGGRYRVTSLLGEGGMGLVYAAVQEDLQRRVALKVIRDEGSSADELRRFRLEALAASQLGHPNIVQVTDFREAAGGDPAFLVMELLEGESLKQLLLRERRLQADRAVFIATQMLAALAAAHEARIVHRDIKPANIFLTRTQAMRDLVKVLDFGVAKMIGAGAHQGTADGAVVGTLAYMAPEQALGMPVDERADLYAVGACLFEMLAGRRPITAIDRTALVAAIVSEPLPKLASMSAGVDPALAAVVDRALSKDPHGRYASAGAMLEALTPFSHAARASSGDVSSAGTTRGSGGASDAATTRGGTALLAPMTVSAPPPTISGAGPPAWMATPQPAAVPPRPHPPAGPPTFTSWMGLHIGLVVLVLVLVVLFVGALMIAVGAMAFSYRHASDSAPQAYDGGAPTVSAPLEDDVWWESPSGLEAAELVGDEADDAIGFAGTPGKNYLAVFDGATMSLAWKLERNPTTRADDEAGFVVLGKRIAVPMDKRSLALVDGATGRELQRRSLPRIILGVCASDTAPSKELFVELEGADVVLDLESGATRATTEVPRGCALRERHSDGRKHYCRGHAACVRTRFEIGYEEFKIEGNVAVVARTERETGDHLLSGLDFGQAKPGKVLWERRAEPSAKIDLIDVIGGRAYAETGPKDKRLFEALDARTGETRWTAKPTTLGPGVVVPAVGVAAGKNRVFVQRLQYADVFDPNGKMLGTVGRR